MHSCMSYLIFLLLTQIINVLTLSLLDFGIKANFASLESSVTNWQIFHKTKSLIKNKLKIRVTYGISSNLLLQGSWQLNQDNFSALQALNWRRDQALQSSFARHLICLSCTDIQQLKLIIYIKESVKKATERSQKVKRNLNNWYSKKRQK